MTRVAIPLSDIQPDDRITYRSRGIIQYARPTFVRCLNSESGIYESVNRSRLVAAYREVARPFKAGDQVKFRYGSKDLTGTLLDEVAGKGLCCVKVTYSDSQIDYYTPPYEELCAP